MYTQCPDCSTAFRVTANDLKQAAGKVRCGGCGSAFDALEFLSEEMPEQPSVKQPARRLPELKPDPPGGGLPEAVSPEESIALLKTLDELAGSDIRIEDTGIEWRLLDDQVIAELQTADDADTAGEPGDDQQIDETRYDDDSPIPEPGDGDDSAPADDDAPDEETSDEETSDAETESESDEQEADDAPDVDFSDDETGEWEEILEEVDDSGAPDESDEADEADEGADDEAEDPETGAVDDEADAEEVDTAFESIIMEGETVRNALDELPDSEQATGGDVSYWNPPEESVVPTRSGARRLGLATVALLLLLLLGLQIVHQYRETLATIPAAQKIIAPAYRLIGMPLSPDWDVTGWRFEATQGSANDETDELTVYSRIGNTSDRPLPYPLIGISLTDRFDETVASRLLEPAEFLTGDENPRRLVPAGATFDAVISIRSPDEAATGYKLNVCYRNAGRASAGQLRCAIGDFKE